MTRPLPRPPLIDRFGRTHTYVRISVTDRCNFRCVYCMPEEGLSWMPRSELLRYEEICAVLRAFARMGVRKVRLTGGEPTLRADIESLIAGLAAIPGLDDIAMTTKGLTLDKLAGRLARAGLHRVNISIDSVDPERFRRLTRGGDLSRVIRGIEAAREAGLTPIKLNAVVLKGENEEDLHGLVDWAGNWPDDLELRFIEYMPFEARWHESVASSELRRRLSERLTLEPDGTRGHTAGPARMWKIAQTGLRVGFISPLSEHFCARCNRLRLQADGHLRTCLAHEDTPSLRDLLRAGADEDTLEQAIRTMVLGKPEGHDCGLDDGTVFEGVMTGIGG
ncbi:MAG: GTP 3',8-cyclase MoaA [Myxococcota bacterium]|nr:GTP 3',8-cyclase MoaA [Myxococcota bacterium]